MANQALEPSALNELTRQPRFDIEQLFGRRLAGEQIGQRRIVHGGAPRWTVTKRLAQLLDRVGQVGALGAAEFERPAGRAQPPVHGRQHRAHALRAVGREQRYTLGLARSAEASKRRRERL